MAEEKDAPSKQVEKDAQGQYSRGDHGRKNDGMASAKPRALPNEPSHNAEAERH
ncbi:hypothetical protein [Mesorhizobium caraganae]|uniref:hypothetical protein n=1 Tax=Mesorhizobium caraganae TaxID=483206 RepID=UPI001FF05DF3|nr:hypothetical protein [Mesorhizobium caraganae]